MEALVPAGVLSVDDLDLLNFTSDEDDDDDKIKAPSSSFVEANPKSQDPDDQRRSCPELVEEDLEWLSNKDSFPALETCFELLPGNPGIVPNHHSPVSVLENSSNSSNSAITSCCGSALAPTRIPVRARSKRRRRRRRGFSDFPLHQCWWWSQTNIKNIKPELPLPLPLPPTPPEATGAIGRRCQHCQAEKTPQWRAGPMGPKTLCNACGVRYKSGRLVPEYRPASSPTFSNVLHSNSHRKIVEMRKQKQLGGMVVNEACGYRVG